MLQKLLIALCLFVCSCTSTTENPVLPTLVEFPISTSEQIIEYTATPEASPTPQILIQPLSPQTVYAAIYAQVKACPRVDCESILVYQSENLELLGVVTEGELLEGSTTWYQVARNNEIIFIHENSITFRDATPIVPTVDWRQEVQPVYYGDDNNTGGSNVSRSSGNSGNSGNSVNSTNNSNNRNPRNCDEAVAMGLSAEEAARAGLDRDGDGVACYGD